MKIAIVSLGCPKNQVDADIFCRALLEAGHETVPETEMADAVIVNTCGFIQSAKEEAIACILDACGQKQENPDMLVLVTGCLAERYRHEIAEEIPEVDAIVGIGANSALPRILQELAARKELCPVEAYGPKSELDITGPRVISTPPHFAWLKIAEGCSNNCSYCAIPAMRGPLRSRPMESVLEEARWLAQQGVRELVLVAQDVTAYGNDEGKNLLPALLDELNTIDGIHWIRLLYAYPERVTPELLDAVLRNEKVLHYFDLPIQHINEDILGAMGRRGGSGAVRGAVRLIREKIPDAVLRTSLITGFPGETDEQFNELCAFVCETRFDRLGCFAYSPEEGTRSADFQNQVEPEVRERRADTIMMLQAAIMAEKQESMVGSVMEVLCDSYDEDENFWFCRGAMDAPEIDLSVLVDGEAQLAPGKFAKVKITKFDGFDLVGTPVD